MKNGCSVLSLGHCCVIGGWVGREESRKEPYRKNRAPFFLLFTGRLEAVRTVAILNTLDVFHTHNACHLNLIQCFFLENLMA